MYCYTVINIVIHSNTCIIRVRDGGHESVCSASDDTRQSCKARNTQQMGE